MVGEIFYKVFNAEARNRPLRGFATHREANTPSEASAERRRVRREVFDRINRIFRIDGLCDCVIMKFLIFIFT